MNIINKKNRVSRKILTILMVSVAFVFGLAFIANHASANNSGFEIPVCSFEQQEGRTVVSFGDKKVVSHLSEEDAKSGPVAVNLEPGSYKVSLFSHDGYEGRDGAFPQPKESWFVILKNGNDTVSESSPIDDLEDLVVSATRTQTVNEELVISQNIDSVSAFSAGYPDEPTPNSVFPVCAAFDLIKLKEEPNHAPVITLVGSSTINLIVGDSFTDPGATATDDEDGDITANIIIGGDTVTTSTAGTYIITYNVSDSDGLVAEEVVRTVIVSEFSDGGGGGGSSSSASSESSSSSSDTSGGGGGGVGGDTEEVVTSGGSSGRISFGGSRLVLPQASLASSVSTATSTPSSSSFGQCSYLEDYLKIGENNDVVEVLKLQAFLSSIEHFNVPLTGVFDQATFDAVSDFQEKYREDILAPWGYDVPTGYVYITTKNKINEIFCGSEISLSEEQKTEIEKVRNYIAEFGKTGGSTGSGSEGIDIGMASTSEGADGLAEGIEESGNLAAGVGFIKSPMAFILDNKVTVAIIGMAITLLVYMFSFRGSKI